MNENLLSRLLAESALTEASALERELRVLNDHLEGRMASIWSINRKANIASIVERVGYRPEKKKEYEFVHSMNDCLIDYFFNELSDKNLILLDIADITKHESYKLHKSKNRVDKLGLKRLIAIPLSFKGDQYIINIYPKTDKKFSDNDAVDVISFFELSLERLHKRRKEYLAEDLTKLYQRKTCLLYTSPSPRDLSTSRMPSSA